MTSYQESVDGDNLKYAGWAEHLVVKIYHWKFHQKCKTIKKCNFTNKTFKRETLYKMSESKGR